MVHFIQVRSQHIVIATFLGLLCLCLFSGLNAAFAQQETPPLLPAEEPATSSEQPAEGTESTQNDSVSKLPALPGLPSLPTSGDALPEGLGASAESDNENLALEQSPEKLEEEARREAFDSALQGLLPLRPSEIRELLEHFDRTQESVELPVYPAPRPEVVVETLSVDPGTKPTSIKTAYGFVTTVNFLDSSGQPWPIQNITWAGNFDIGEVEASPDRITSTLRITPQSDFAYGNMAIHLVGFTTPIILSLETSRDVVHYRFDAIIPETGPLGKAPIIEGSNGIEISAGDADMSAVLEGAPPPRAVKMDVSGVDSRTTAYRFNGLTYLRTPLTLLSPAWIGSSSSADGMRVYAMGHAPVLLLSERGKLVRARLSDREDLADE